jgi:thiol:disulfide interchange protein DsbC
MSSRRNARKNVLVFKIICYNFNMPRFFATAFFIILMALSLPAFAAESPAASGMTTPEALNALKEIIPEVKVLEVNATPVQGLFEVAVETKGQKGIIYLDSSRKYLISGSIVNIATKQNLTQERFSEINKVNVSEIPLDDALVMGNKNAPKRVIVFTDPD